ncbi:P-loop containing nucleoside triphosphate hydrolase protein [Tuber magnatum]|uniref:P-loop containing nucleoside triphosphate hydrolase protein n=1 Tax=Tuber magnatum TaxID=42249 RepID=A0A317SXZ0_9PEZI|nr:P-loop containing nucleoside triphosphate hydrolase protein [Tuber magnatum]
MPGPKRRRRDAPASEEEEEEEEESPAEEEPAPSRNFVLSKSILFFFFKTFVAKRPRFNYESDGGDDDLELSSSPRVPDYDFDLEELSTQRAEMEIREEMAIEKPNVPAENGIIQSVTCQNFMCHRWLEIKFGPFVNFVIGHNGSGKSAILTAITLCLGGKAAATNRGTSMKSLIKEGEDTSRITVKLKNRGDGFKTEQYGDAILIERNFTRDGSSGYKLKSSDGKVISSKKEELEEICDYFGLQVDNPMTILTQDSARQFLSSSTNAEKYKFFAKGVNLEQLDQDYALIKNGIDSTDAVLHNKLADIDDLKKLMVRANKRLDQLKSHETLRDKIEVLIRQMAWAQVRDAEVELGEKVKKTNLAESKVTKAEAERETASKSFDDAHQVYEEAVDKVNKAKAKLAPVVEAKEIAKEAVDNNKKELQGLLATEREIKGSFEGSQRKITETKNEILAEERRLSENDGGKNSRLIEEQEQHEKEAGRARDALQDLEVKNTQNKSALEAAKREVSKARAAADSCAEDLQGAQAHLSQIRKSEQNFMNAFDRKMPQLLSAINKERRFKKKPVGPVGVHVTLRDPKWLHIVENIFGSTLNAFLVADYEDVTMLKKLMREVGLECPINVISQGRMDLEEPSPNFKTVLRVLEITDDSVRRGLIVGNAIEQTILIDDLQEATDAMERRRHGDNIGMCFSINKQSPDWGHKVGGACTDILSIYRQVEDQINRLRASLDSAKHALRNKQEELRTIERDIDEYRSNRSKLNYEVHKCEDAVDKVKALLEENAQNDGKLETLKAKLKVWEERMEMNGRQYEEFVVSKENLSATASRLVAQLRAANQAASLAAKRVEDAQLDEATARRRREQCLANKNHWYEKHRQYEEDAAALRAVAEEAKSRVDRYIQAASTVCPRVLVPRGDSTAALDNRLTKLQRELERAEQMLGGTAAEVTAQAQQATLNYTQARDQRASFQELLRIAISVYKERLRRWGLFQCYISARARAQFSWMMSERAFKGRLRLEHTWKPAELIIEVQPGQQDTGNRGPKTLSGGEKSFSTICLLLSLWEAMGSPIRCLDEFDVFMDAINRNISVNMMIRAAERSIGKQFILITPQTMNNQNTTNQVKIIKMRDPERDNAGQTRIDG